MTIPSSKETVMEPDGLHYRHKPNGSPFGAPVSLKYSCFRCGVHRSRPELHNVRFMGRCRWVCLERCRSSTRDSA